MIRNGGVPSTRRRRTKSETKSPYPADDDESDIASAPLQSPSPLFSSSPPPSPPPSPSCHHPKKSCCVLSAAHILFVAERTVKDWQRILRHLGVEQHVIERIEVDYPSSSVERAYKGYLHWERSNPKAATCCTLFDVLDEVKRSDLRIAMEERFSIEGKVARKNSMYTTSVKYFVGREEEIKRIQEFCSKEQKTEKLLCVNGLPGSGKKELVIEALNKIDRSEIVKPNFMIEDKDAWTFRDLLDCILRELRKFISHEISGKVNVVDLLVDLEKPCLLILEIAHLKLNNIIFSQIWTFIHDVLRNNNNRLKIIATSCKQPDEVLCDNINYDVIFLGDLGLGDSIKLLKRLNPLLTTRQIEDIYESLGGNPLLLRKVSGKIKSFDKHDEEVRDFINSIQDNTSINDTINVLASDSEIYTDYQRQESNMHEELDYQRQESNMHEELYRLVKATNWWYDMTSVFNMMDRNEKVVLATASVFHEKIPRRSFACIFNNERLSKDAENLCMNHCILQKTHNNTCYSITEIYKTFIIKHIESLTDAEGEFLKKVRVKSKVQRMDYFIQLIIELSRLFFSKSKKRKSYEICDNFIKDFRDLCTSCKDNCQCENYTVSKGIFLKHKTTFLRSLNKVMLFPDHRRPLFNAPYEVVEFLRHVLSHKEVCEIYKEMWNSVIDNDEKAVLLACLVFIKIYQSKRYSNEQVLYLQMINQCIKAMARKADLTIGLQEILLACYLKKASILVNVANDYASAQIEIDKAKEIYFKPGVRIGIFNYYGVLADIDCCCKSYAEGKKKREHQLNNFTMHIGNHPLTAKAHYLMGKVCERMRNYSCAITCYNEALQMYHNINHHSLQYGTVSLALTKLLLERKRMDDAKKLIEHGIMVMQNLRDSCQCTKTYLYNESSRLLMQFSQLSGKGTDEQFHYVQSPRRQKIMRNSEYFLNRQISFSSSVSNRNVFKYFLIILLFLCLALFFYIINSFLTQPNCKTDL